MFFEEVENPPHANPRAVVVIRFGNEVALRYARQAIEFGQIHFALRIAVLDAGLAALLQHKSGKPVCTRMYDLVVEDEGQSEGGMVGPAGMGSVSSAESRSTARISRRVGLTIPQSLVWAAWHPCTSALLPPLSL
jgi:hypothetical protein